MGPKALLPLRRKARWVFFRPKNPTASAGFDPANLGTKGQHAHLQATEAALAKVTYWNYDYSIIMSDVAAYHVLFPV